MLIRTVTEDDLEALWALRLQALGDNPEAFGSTYDEVLARGKDWLRGRLRQAEDVCFYLGAFEETLWGMIGFVREEGSKSRHKGLVVSLYVRPEVRRQGTGRALLKELIARAGRLDGLEQLHLAVVTSALPAAELYRSLGFELYGTEPHALKAGDRYWDEDLMVLPLARR